MTNKKQKGRAGGKRQYSGKAETQACDMVVCVSVCDYLRKEKSQKNMA